MASVECAPDAPDLYPGLLLSEPEVGAQRWRTRVLPGPGVLLQSITGFALVGAVLWVLDGVHGLIALVGLGLVFAVLVGGPALETCRVHENGLVVELQGRRVSPYVIPWASVDVDLVRLHHRAHLLGRRTGPRRPSTRQPVWCRTAVSLVGLAPDYASAHLRSSRLFDVRRMLQAGEPLMPLPLAVWYLGPGRPERLLRALEAALVDAGHAQAKGLADRCLAEPVRERYRRPLTDEQVYGRAWPRRLTG